MYSNEIDIEGLVAVTSTWLRFAIHPEGIHGVLKGYSEVYDKLKAIDEKYPTPDSLAQLVGEGAVKYGMEGVGDAHDSSGSDALIRAVDRVDEKGRPLHVCLWGGANVLGQVSLASFVQKLMMLIIGVVEGAKGSVGYVCCSLFVN